MKPSAIRHLLTYLLNYFFLNSTEEREIVIVKIKV